MGQFAKALVVLAFVLSAGCATKDSPAPALETSFGAPSVVMGNGTAQIVGKVVDPELVPIAAARVQIVHRQAPTEQPMLLATDESGSFRAEGLAEGEYLLYVGKPGYRDAPPKPVTASSEPVEVLVELEPIPVPVAHSALLQYRVQFTEQACVIAPTRPYCLTGYTVANTTTGFEVDELSEGPLETVVVESKWTPTVGACANGLRTDLYSPQQETTPTPGYDDTGTRAPENPYHWDNVPEAVKSPTRLFVPREGETPNAIFAPERMAKNQGLPLVLDGKWWITTYAYPVGLLGTAVDVSCSVLQVADVLATRFFVAPAPSDYSAIQ